MKDIFLCLVLILWSLISISGQHESFLDALYIQETTDINAVKQSAQLSEIDYWNKHNGISLQLAARSRGGEELIVDRPSIVASAKIDLLGKGIKDHRLSADILQQRMALEQMLGCLLYTSDAADE